MSGEKTEMAPKQDVGIVPTSKEAIRERYDRIARWYDLLGGIPEVLGVKRLRRTLLRRASGRVLEVAVGTGKNLRYYPRGCEITAADLSPGMLEVARVRARRSGLRAPFLRMDAELLAFRGRAFDTIVSSLSLCTVPDPVEALREMGRVCRPGGRILLLEHGRSDRGWLGRWQDRRADRHARPLGCRWNREPLDLIGHAGLRVVSAQRTFLGIFHVLEVAPPA